MAFLAKIFRDIYYPYRIFTVLCLSFLLGIFIASLTNISFLNSSWIFAYTISALLLAALFNQLFKSKVLVLISFCLIFLSLGSGYYSYNDWKNYRNIIFEQDLEIVGKISQRPEPNYKNQKVVIKITECFSNGTRLKDIEGAKIIVRLPTFPEYRFGEYLSLQGKISQPENFSGFDYKNYLKRWHIVGEVKNPVKINFKGSSANPIDKGYGFLYSIANTFEIALNKVLPEPHSSLASGILLGVKRNIPDDLMLDLQKTGLTHIIALSGFNVTILIAIFARSLVMYLGRRQTFLLGTTLVILFVIMTGASASVVRAAIFSLLILFGTTIGKRADQTNLLLLAALAMVVINPYILPYDVGFQLSFLAFAGLIYLTPIIGRYIEKKNFKFISKNVGSTLSETLGAQFAVTPLILYQFGLVSLISPIANLLVVWIIPWIMLATFATGLLSLIYYPLGKLVVAFLWPGLEYILRIVEFLANIPLAAINFGK